MEVVFNVLEIHIATYKTKLMINEDEFKELKDKGVSDSAIVINYSLGWNECIDLILEYTLNDSIAIVDEEY